MKSLPALAEHSAVIPLAADDILELHAARLLLLLAICGKDGTIEGLTKFAKLDFFVRYPDFFEQVTNTLSPSDHSVESPMIRHHYGPWDHRYYHLLAFLEARGLIVVSKSGKRFDLSLTTKGRDIAAKLETEGTFLTTAAHMHKVAGEFGNKTGNALKNLIYKVFRTEVADANLGEEILG